jgi:hypothetical protein
MSDDLTCLEPATNGMSPYLTGVATAGAARRAGRDGRRMELRLRHACRVNHQ